MTIKQVILKSLDILNLTDTIKRFNSGTESDEERGRFLALTRDVVAELVMDLYPLKVTEFITPDANGVVKLKNLTRPVIDVYSVTVGDRALPFTLKYDCMDVKTTATVCVEYSFMPDLSSMDSVIPFESRMDEKTIALGVAAEYCIIHRPSEYVMFEGKYQDRLKRNLRQKNERRVKNRRWL